MKSLIEFLMVLFLGLTFGALIMNEAWEQAAIRHGYAHHDPIRGMVVWDNDATQGR